MYRGRLSAISIVARNGRGSQMPEPARITELAQREAELFLAEQSRQFIDAAINLAATSMPIPAVIRLLKDHIELLEEFG